MRRPHLKRVGTPVVVHRRSPVQLYPPPAPNGQQQPTVVHHYHHTEQRSSGGGSLAFWLFISILFPCVGGIVGIAFLFIPDRRGHGALLLGLSTLFAIITYMVLSALNYIPRL